jgi:hypothetical protein
MSLSIKDTPILRGKDARRFIENMNKAKDNPVSKEEYERARKIYEELIKKDKLWNVG